MLCLTTRHMGLFKSRLSKVQLNLDCSFSVTLVTFHVFNSHMQFETSVWDSTAIYRTCPCSPCLLAYWDKSCSLPDFVKFYQNTTILFHLCAVFGCFCVENIYSLVLYRESLPFMARDFLVRGLIGNLHAWFVFSLTVLL